MTPVLEAVRLTKRYGRRLALSDCHLSVPPGRVVGLVGPNGAGKSTLLNLACGLIQPTSGAIRVLGAQPAADPAHLAKVGFVAQDTPVYADLSVAEHLRLGRSLNPAWDDALAQRWIARIGLDPGQRAGRLSGGQRAQLALTLAASKRPELLIFDEPAAALDPLSRSGFLDGLVELVADLGASAILSSHALADVERVCDYLVVLADSRIQVAGVITELLGNHFQLVADRDGLTEADLPAGVELVGPTHGPSHSTMLVRTLCGAPVTGPWHVRPPDLEELVLAYMTRSERPWTGSAPMTPEVH